MPEPASPALTIAASFAQEQFWFLHHCDPNGSCYNVPVGIRLRGRLDRHALDRSFEQIVRRHETLRTWFSVRNGTLVQVIEQSASCRPSVTDLAGFGDAEARALALIQDEIARTIELTRPPLARAALIRLAEDDHLLVVTLHHLICDGWSLGVLVRELGALYSAFVRGKPSPLAPLRIQYADFAVWQRNRLQGGLLEEQREYWRRYLEGAPGGLQLRADGVQPFQHAHRAGRVDFVFGPELGERVRALSQRCEATLFMSMVTAFAVLLHRYSGQDDICIGYPAANRSQPDLEDVIGPLVNMLVLRLSGLRGRSFEWLLRDVRESVVQASGHQEMPLEKVVRDLDLQREIGRNPYFRAVCVCYDGPSAPLAFSGLVVDEFEVRSPDTEFDLSLFVVAGEGGISGAFHFRAGLFEESAAERMARNFEVLLAALVDAPDRRGSTLPLLASDERVLLANLRGPEQDLSTDALAPHLFEAQALNRPDALAVRYRDEELTYGELNERANKLANHIRGCGIGPEDRVAILTHRSIATVVAMLAVTKAAATYLPLDPAYPKSRLSFILHDASVRLVLTQQGLCDLLECPGVQIVNLDTGWERIDREESTNPAASIAIRALAYVIYTSGSTGEPNGVEIPHAGLLNLIAWHRHEYKLGPADRTTQLAALCFDACVWEMWPTLACGASLHIVDDETRCSPAQLVRWLASEAITVAFLPTALAELVLSCFEPLPASLRALLTGGERLDRLRSAVTCNLVNHYGLTECSVVSTCGAVTAESGSAHPPSIGRPIANTSCYVLDKDGQQVPIGVAGELYIGGAGLARGYVGRPDLTAERFVPDSFGGEPGARLYRTGDTVRCAGNGEIEFVGRIDRQLKVSGYRVAAEEIEEALLEHADVRRCVVTTIRTQSGSEQLIAYVTTDQGGEFSLLDCRNHLRDRIPAPMIPSAIVRLDELPVLPNGKLDRAALPAPTRSNSIQSVPHVAPQGEFEEALIRIWSDALGIEGIGVNDRFLDLGGYSLKAIYVAFQIRARFGIELPLRTVIASETVAELAEQVETAVWFARTAPAMSVSGHVVGEL